jgi:hypothetical protein
VGSNEAAEDEAGGEGWDSIVVSWGGAWVVVDISNSDDDAWVILSQ